MSNTPPSETPTIEQQANNNAKQIGQVIGNVTIYESNPIPNESSCKKGNDQFIPDYLCYLPDRNAQREKLCKAIKEHERIAKHRPLLCLIYGETQEEHYSFKDCFVEAALPTISEISNFYHNDGQNNVKQKRIFAVPKNIEGLHNTILDELGKYFFVDSDKNAIAKQLFKEKRPIILCIDIFIESYQDQNDLIKQGIFEFWENWPDPDKGKQHYRLIVFLLFRYPNQENKWLNLLKPLNRLQRKLTQAFNQLENQDLSTFLSQSKVGAVVLPELRPIEKAAAIEWFNDCQKYVVNAHIDRAITKIEDFYKNYPKGAPMKDLAETLTKIVNEIR